MGTRGLKFEWPREYRSWCMMKTRCYNKKASDYKNYGGRGITVCEQWRGPCGFAAFLDDLGPRPNGTTLDRRDNNLNYTPDNCRWATVIEQNRKRRSVKLTMHDARCIRNEYRYGNVTQTWLARKYGVGHVQISRIVSNKRWIDG